jgi:phosphoglycerate-specific signal transduction histidine kinase
MAYADDIKKTIEKGVSIAKEGVAYAAARAEDLSLAAALRIRIFALRRRMERLFGELGETAFQLTAKNADVRADASAKKYVKKIAALEREVDGLFEELDALSRKSRGVRRRPATKKRAAAGAKKTRPANR